jgi:ketosteroid isomerase-like protein
MDAPEERLGGTVERRVDSGRLRSDGASAIAEAFGRALLARDPHAAAAFFSPAGRMLTPDGTEVSGREQIVGILRQITGSDQELEIRIGRSVVSETAALCTQIWRRRSGGRGESFESSTMARLVLQLGAEGWKIAIASPFE